MRFILRRESDGAGDCGLMSRLFNDDGPKPDAGVRPKIGYGIAVGSFHARAFKQQDFWQTTEIEEILEETETRVRFRTRNSVYVWEVL